MSQSTMYRLYTERRPNDPQAALRDALRITGAEAGNVSVLKGPDRAWEDFLAEQAGRRVRPREQAKSYRRVAVADMPALYEGPGGFLLADLFPSGRSREAQEQFERLVSPALRDRTVLANFSLHVGPADMLDSTDMGEVFRVARPWFAFVFFGYGVPAVGYGPADRAEFQRQVGALPEIVAIRRELEEVVGPLEEYVLLDY